MAKRLKWKTRYGFYFAAIGSAFGLGNLWRFPYIVSENGGGAFVLLYVALAMGLGVPILIAELLLGRSQRAPVIMATEAMSVSVPVARWAGRLSLILALVILAYYTVISGWVLYFVIQFLRDAIFPIEGAVALSLKTLTENGLLQVGLASVHVLLCGLIVAKGVHEGIERWIGSLMPIFGVLLIGLLWQSLNLPTATEAVRFLFYPNFSALTLTSLGHAVGHVCFTLGVGLGTMVTFGSYLNDRNNTAALGLRVGIMDTVFSLMAGVLVFPIALSASNVPLTDPGLLFEALPRFLAEKRAGAFFGLVFFVSLYLAALGGSLGLFEVIVSNAKTMRIRHLAQRSRVQLSAGSGMVVLSLAALPALLAKIDGEVGSRGLLTLVDGVLINWLLPISCLLMCFAISRGLRKSMHQHLFEEQKSAEAAALFPHWWFAIRWGIPGVISLGLGLQLIDLLRAWL